MDQQKIQYCYECETVEIRPAFEYLGKKYRKIEYRPDFKIWTRHKSHLIEVKGYETPEFKLKWKLIQYHFFVNGLDTKIEITKSLKDFKALYEKLNNEPATTLEIQSTVYDTEQTTDSI